MLAVTDDGAEHSPGTLLIHVTPTNLLPLTVRVRGGLHVGLPDWAALTRKELLSWNALVKCLKDSQSPCKELCSGLLLITYSRQVRAWAQGGKKEGCPLKKDRWGSCFRFSVKKVAPWDY